MPEQPKTNSFSVHQLHFGNKVALSLGETANITGATELQLLQMGRSTSRPAKLLPRLPPPELRFCIKRPRGFQVFKVAPALLNQISNIADDGGVENPISKKMVLRPEHFENFDFLVLSPEDCATLCNRGEVDVSIFRNGIAFDQLSIPRSLPFEDPTSQFHRVLALSRTPANFTGHYTDAPFVFSQVTIAKDDLYILVSDLSFLMSLDAKERSTERMPSEPHDDTPHASFGSAHPSADHQDVANDLNSPANQESSEDLVEGSEQTVPPRDDNKKVLAPFGSDNIIEAEHLNHASTDLRNMFAVAKSVWGKDFRKEDCYPADKDVAKIVEKRFIEQGAPAPKDRVADYLARLIRPVGSRKAPDDSYEEERGSRFVNTYLKYVFEVSSELSGNRAEFPSQKAIQTRLINDGVIPKYLRSATARAILGQFSSHPSKKKAIKNSVAPNQSEDTSGAVFDRWGRQSYK